MKILQSALHGCATLGFGPQQPTTQKYPINRKNMRALSILCSALILSCTYFFLNANTFQEYAMSVYVSTTLMLGIGVYLIFIWKNQPIGKLFELFEKTIDESEPNST